MKHKTRMLVAICGKVTHFFFFFFLEMIEVVPFRVKRFLQTLQQSKSVWMLNWPACLSDRNNVPAFFFFFGVGKQIPAAVTV